ETASTPGWARRSSTAAQPSDRLLATIISGTAALLIGILQKPVIGGANEVFWRYTGLGLPLRGLDRRTASPDGVVDIKARDLLTGGEDRPADHGPNGQRERIAILDIDAGGLVLLVEDYETVCI